MEGAGGWFSPLSWQVSVADLAVWLGLPVVLVVPDRLGAVSQSLQALFSIQNYGPGCPVAAVVLNRLVPPKEQDPSASSNASLLRQHCPGVPVVVMEYQGMFDPPVDWQALGS